MASDHHMLLITTGGTIAGQVASDKLDTESVRDAGDLLAIIGSTVSHLNRKYNLNISIDSHPLCNVDSSNILPKHWSDLVALIRDKYDDYDSFIITHGTNTLGYTCAALSFAIANSSKPIVLTGSQVSAGLPGSDGITNLENALRVAVWRYRNRQMKGVVAVFGSHIITGTRVKKETEFDYDAFISFGTGSIGRIGRIINIDEGNLSKHQSYLETAVYPEARNANTLRCDNEFDMRILSLTEFPGMSSCYLREFAERLEVRGVILRAFGAGDPCTRHLESFEILKRYGIPVVITTQAPNGNSNFQVNQPGKVLKDKGLAIPAHDMSIESMTVKLAWLLPKKKELGYEKLCEEMVRDMRGEINVMWEVGG